jgi:dTDP-4-amino-4,6-dideoxygalactose transaminase
MYRIPLTRPFIPPRGLEYLQRAIAESTLVGDGAFSRACERDLEAMTGSPRVVLTPSGTAAIELAALALDLSPGDEVVMPSFTFPSTANAFALRGAVPVFCDVRGDTLNVDRACIEPCLGPRTRAIVVVHYAGNPCDMAPIVELCRSRGLVLVEDAAQAIGATQDGTAAGCFGDFGAFSFHATKNLACGEGGALAVNRAESLERIEILREKGTDRSRFLRGEVDKYSWQDIGSSWVVSELVAAYLKAQLECAAPIAAQRLQLWQRYQVALAPLQADGVLRRPVLTPGATHNAHLYPILLPDESTQVAVGAALRAQGIEASRHYVPLHRAPAGRRLGRAPVPLAVTDSVADRLLRLPLWPGLSTGDQDEVIERLHEILRRP